MTRTVGELPASIAEGDIIAGKYRIDGVIGSGAMGVVVEAWHLLLEERVAIKFLRPQAMDSREAIARFMREARAAVKIKSEHVARVGDVGLLEDGTPYIVMEFLDGCDLAEWLRTRGPLPIALAVEFVLQACEALAEAHSFGIVHRDLKPANLFVVERVDGVQAVKVLDFGISKTLRGAGLGGAITDTMTVMGSPLYMSPEQMESARTVDARTDVWALGAILCELVTGRPPYDGDSMAQVYARIVGGQRLRLRQKSPELPPELEAVLLRCLQRNRAARYRNVAELAAALMRFAPARAHSSVDRISRVFHVGPGVATEGAPPSSPSPHVLSVDRTLRSSGRPATTGAPARSRAAFVAGAIALLVVGAAVARSVGSRSSPSTAQASGGAARAASAPGAEAAPSEPAAAREPAAESLPRDPSAPAFPSPSAAMGPGAPPDSPASSTTTPIEERAGRHAAGAVSDPRAPALSTNAASAVPSATRPPGAPNHAPAEAASARRLATPTTSAPSAAPRAASGAPSASAPIGSVGIDALTPFLKDQR